MKLRRLLITMCALGWVACGGTNPTPTPEPPVTPANAGSPDMAMAPPPAAMVVDVTLSDSLMFQPMSISVPRGGTVRWTNKSSVTHTVTSGASSNASDAGALFDHNPLRPGETFEHTFDTAGAQPYFCRFHEAMGMKGVINVTP